MGGEALIHCIGGAQCAPPRARGGVGHHPHLHPRQPTAPHSGLGRIQRAQLGGGLDGGGRFTDLVKLCIEKDVHLIAIEPQYRDQSKAAATLRDLLHEKNHPIELVEIDPLEAAGAKEVDAGWYVRKMKANLDQLATRAK